MIELAEDELWNLGKVWAFVYASLTYCHVIGKIIPKGFTRLVAILPVVFLFLLLPLNLTSIALCGTTAFFVSWLANFKLLLFAFGKPPLALNPHIPFLHFLAVASLPIIVPSYQHHRDQEPYNEVSVSSQNLKNAPTKVAIIVLLFWMLYDYGYYIDQKVLWLMYFVIIYLMLEMILACVATLARFVIGLDLKPQFKDPLSCTSTQDFWGKRWNLVASDILRPTVYQPSREAFAKIIGHNNATYVATMITFMVSGIMHELIFYYLGRTRPTFEVTWFFLVNGVLVCLEIAAKRYVAGIWEVPEWISGLMTLSFVVMSGFWLFIPAFLRGGSDVRMLHEYAAICSFLRSIDSFLRGKFIIDE
ncbi:hypothetical protein vseg_011639 [Gypsophila vaccaria]